MLIWTGIRGLERGKFVQAVSGSDRKASKNLPQNPP